MTEVLAPRKAVLLLPPSRCVYISQAFFKSFVNISILVKDVELLGY